MRLGRKTNSGYVGLTRICGESFRDEGPVLCDWFRFGSSRLLWVGSAGLYEWLKTTRPFAGSILVKLGPNVATATHSLTKSVAFFCSASLCFTLCFFVWRCCALFCFALFCGVLRSYVCVALWFSMLCLYCFVSFLNFDLRCRFVSRCAALL